MIIFTLNNNFFYIGKKETVKKVEKRGNPTILKT